MQIIVYVNMVFNRTSTKGLMPTTFCVKTVKKQECKVIKLFSYD